jgi:hypothetical protein
MTTAAARTQEKIASAIRDARAATNAASDELLTGQPNDAMTRLIVAVYRLTAALEELAGIEAAAEAVHVKIALTESEERIAKAREKVLRAVGLALGGVALGGAFGGAPGAIIGGLLGLLIGAVARR